MWLQMLMVQMFALGLAVTTMATGLPSFAYTLPSKVAALSVLLGGEAGRNVAKPQLFGMVIRSRG